MWTFDSFRLTTIKEQFCYLIAINVHLCFSDVSTHSTVGWTRQMTTAMWSMLFVFLVHNKLTQIEVREDYKVMIVLTGSIAFSVSVLVILFILYAGDAVIMETVRQIMAARAIYNVFKMTEFQLTVSSNSLRSKPIIYLFCCWYNSLKIWLQITFFQMLSITVCN